MRTVHRRPTRKGFTLVELVTAASLMTVMMLGVVEIFGIVATTAGDAEGVHFAHQQMRAFFDRLHSDIRGMTREGYLNITKGSVVPSRAGSFAYQPNSAAATGTQSIRRYGADSLAFVTVGVCRSQMGSSPLESNAAEVVYTNQVKTDGQQILRVDGQDVTVRRGVLARSLWIMGSTATSTGLWSGQSEHGYLCHLFAEENERILSLQGGGRGGSTPPPPELLSTRGAAREGAVHVDPWVADRAATAGSNPDSLNRVMASCVSEFYVEAFTPVSMGANYWHGGDDAARTYRWADTYESAGDTIRYNTREPIQTWPQAIRVTVAVHDPGKTGDIPDGQDRYRGVAMQETFWLGDP